jgi:hypothetical protein
MAFVPEDGTGLPNANSYGLVAEADEYFVDRGNGAWAALDTNAKQSALIQATDYIDMRYGSRFIGQEKTNTQGLEWPRIFQPGDKSYEETYGGTGEIPKDLKYATFEYASRASKGPLAPDPVFSEAGVSVITTHQRVGEVERRFAPTGMSGAGQMWLIKPYPAADLLLQDLLDPYQGDRVIR